jgi:TolB-like protein
MSFLQELKRRNVLRVATAYIVGSWLLIQVSETIFPLFGFGAAPARLVVIVLAIGFVPSLIFSWVFEITPEGLKRDADVDREQPITQGTGKKLDRIILVVLALALAYFAFDKFVLDPARDQSKFEIARQEGRTEAIVDSYGDKSIAVLPFVNMSDDANNEYFSDGISEELLNLLSKIPEMRVISRSSAFSFKGKEMSVPVIATQLNVAYVLEGSVRKAGKQVRITAQLIDARSDTHLWSETYDRELEDIFAVQDEISAAITHALKPLLGLKLIVAPQAVVVTNTEAHDAYLRGRYLVLQRTQSAIESAALEFEKAIALDPDYALAHAELAITTILLQSYGNLGRDESRTKAYHHAERSMALDPNLAEAHAATGFLAGGISAYEESLSHYEKAIEINPSYSDVYNWKATEHGRLGQYGEELVARETGLRLDPLSLIIHVNYLSDLMHRDRLDEANLELEKLVSTAPAFAASMRGNLASVGGNWADMIIGNLDAMQIDPKVITRDELPAAFAIVGLKREVLPTSRTQSLLILGKTGDAATLAEKRLAEGRVVSLWSRRVAGLALAAAGDYARARPFLEDMWQRRGRVVREGLFEVNHAAALIAIRRDAGEYAEVSELLAAIRDNVRRYREAGLTGRFWTFNVDYEEGLATFLGGERERGLALIAKAAEDGFFIMPNQAYLQTLYDDPGFAPILASQQARQQSERNRFLAIVCPDNPYAAVWQPAEETCEQFAAKSGN